MSNMITDELDPLRERPALDFSKGVRGKHYAGCRLVDTLLTENPVYGVAVPQGTSRARD